MEKVKVDNEKQVTVVFYILLKSTIEPAMTGLMEFVKNGLISTVKNKAGFVNK